MIPRTSEPKRGPPNDAHEDAARVPTDPTGRLLVTRRAIADIVRNATLGSYGVIGLEASPLRRLLARAGIGSPGIRIDRRDGALSIELDLIVGHGLPIAEVARQVDAAVRHALRRAIDREIGTIAIHVEHLRFETGRGDAGGSGKKTGSPPDESTRGNSGS